MRSRKICEFWVVVRLFCGSIGLPPMTTGPVAMAPNAALVCIEMSGDISMVFSVVWLGTDFAAPEHWLQRLCDETRF